MDSATDAQQQQAHNNAGASASGAHHNDGDDEMSAAAASKQRQQQRADNIRRAEEVHAIRGEPLGSDRRHNRYWRIAADPASGAEPDPGTGRVLFESHQNGTWWLLGHSYQLQHLLSSLERKGAREGALHSALLRQQTVIEQGRPALPIQRPLNPQEQSQHQRSQLDMQHHSCLWSLTVQALPYLSGADPVSSLPVNKGESSGLTKLRADMLRVEAALPLSAMKDANWNSNAWQAAVKGADSALQLRQLLGELEMAVHEGFLWQNHAQPRQPLLIKGAWMPIGKHLLHLIKYIADCCICMVGVIRGALLCACLSSAMKAMGVLLLSAGQLCSTAFPARCIQSRATSDSSTAQALIYLNCCW